MGLNKKDNKEASRWRDLMSKKVKEEVKVVCAEVSRDEYVEYLEDKILTLQAKLDEKEYATKSAPIYGKDLWNDPWITTTLTIP